MQHTYLRYECADAFGLISATASSKVPQSNSTLAFASSNKGCPVVLTSAGSHCIGFHLKTTNPTIKIGHREDQNGGIGTGKALNSAQVVCLDVAHEVGGDGNCRVATGWVDGAVRVFALASNELNLEGGLGLVQTLLDDEDFDDEYITREPLVLNGHSGSPIRSIIFDPNNSARLASGSSDGAVVLWDVVEECGLFRLLGHRAAITDIHFASLENGSLDLLITSSLDGLVKVWDLQGQCCVQTIASHRGKVWAAALLLENPPSPPEVSGLDSGNSMGSPRARLITGDDDGQAKVWSVHAPPRHTIFNPSSNQIAIVEDSGDEASTDCCEYMGSLRLPSTMSTPDEHVANIRFDSTGRYLGVLHANAKSIYIYVVRSPQESYRRKQRRLSRKRQKEKKAQEDEMKQAVARNKKRGILDDVVEQSDNTGPEVNSSAVREKGEAGDEFEFLGTATASHKIRNFVFVPWKEKGSMVRLVCSLTTNALEVVSLHRSKNRDEKHGPAESSSISMVDMLGHSTGIRAVELSSDDSLACTVSKNSIKIWNVAHRNCIQSASHSIHNQSYYGLCATFLPGNSHLVVGTREGHLLLLDIAAGEVSLAKEGAHAEAIWSVDLRRPTDQQPTISLVTGSADRTVRFWEIETADGQTPLLTHARTLEMSDDVVAVRFSNSMDPAKRMVFVSSMDSTVKVFFEDTLKFFLSLYGHKLPALAVDASDDDAILATSGADKQIFIWGLDFGDTHRRLHGHEDSVTALRFVRRTHNFFTSSRDGSVRYWDGDRFEQILILSGHFAEVSSLAISRTGAFVLSAGMDRQVRVWERTKDMVFLEEERGLQLERRFDQIDGQMEQGTGELLRKKTATDDEEGEGEPQSAAAVKQSVMSIAAGDRILAAIELADQELKATAALRRSNVEAERTPNPLLLGMDPTMYMLWILKSVKHAELEQSLLVLPVDYVSRLLYYLVALLRNGQGVEICSRVAIFLVKTHQYQIQANNWKLAKPLQELRRLLRLRLDESRSIVGFNLSGLNLVSQHFGTVDKIADNDFTSAKAIWSGIGLANRS